MTGESQGRPTQRMSRFSKAYRDSMPPDRVLDPVLEADRANGRSDTNGAAAAPDWQRFAPADPYAETVEETIEVEFETVEPRRAPSENGQSPWADAYRQGNGAAMGYDATPGAMQPPPPDIEAIAAALAEEMDRNAARNAQQAAPAADDLPLIAKPDETPADETQADAAPAASEPIALPPPASPGRLARLRALAGQTAHFARTKARPVFVKAETRSDDVPAAGDPVDLPAPPPSPDRLARMRALAGQSANFARAKAGPAFVKSAFWLAHNLRRKEIRRRYGKAVAMTHSKVLDRRLEKHFFIPSLKAERFAPDAERSILYEGPVPAKVFGWVLAAAPADLREYAFVDFRAGLGRAMLLASQRNFDRIVGYEHDLARYDDLQMNIAQFPRSKMVCRDIQCFRSDRSGISIPEQPCILYFSNAWREDLLDGIINYIGDSYRHKPRRLYVVLENVDDKVALPRDEIFYRVDLPIMEKLKLRLFSPIDFQVYRTLA